MSKLTKKVGKINSSTGLQSGPISDEREFIKDTTKLFGKHNLNKYEESTPYTPPYKVYTALLTQSGTDAPVATVLENTLGGTVVWTRDDVGTYTGTLSGGFTGTTPTMSYVYKPDGYADASDIFYVCSKIDNNSIMITLGNTDNGLFETNPLSASFIEIRVYD